MYIPSYDDLTPPIPDADVRDTFALAAEIAAPRAGLHRGSGVQETFCSETQEPPELLSSCSKAPDLLNSCEHSGAALFACLRSTRAPDVMFAIARDFSPRIQRHGSSDVVLDVSGLGRLLGDAHAIGGELERAAAARASDARIAVAPTQTAARLLAITSPGLMVAAGEVARTLADLPLSALGHLLQDAAHAGTFLESFRCWGLRTLGDVAALPPGGLSQRMGQAGVAWQRLACGIDPAPLVPDPGVPRYVETMELEWPIDTLEPLSFVLARLLDPLSAALERADRAAAAIRLDLRLVDRTTHTRLLQLPAAMRDPRVLRTLLLLDLESHPPATAIDIVSIEVDPAPSRIVQYSLLERATPSAETMATLMARLHALVGESRCGFAALADTHRPDGFEMRPLEEIVGVKAARRGPRRVAALRQGSGRADRTRPSGCETSGGPAVPTIVLRRFRPPVAVRVTLDHGRPSHVAIDRRGMPGGAVTDRAGPWRTSGGWWQGAETHWDRDEWDMGFADGTVARIYRDRASGVWFLEGVID